MLSRRNLFFGVAGLIAAPSIVRAASLMPARSLESGITVTRLRAGLLRVTLHGVSTDDPDTYLIQIGDGHGVRVKPEFTCGTINMSYE